MGHSTAPLYTWASGLAGQDLEEVRHSLLKSHFESNEISLVDAHGGHAVIAD